jgi:hypothetical protein
VTRGTRPKKPSSSRGFAHEARRSRGSWGSWGLKTEFFFLFSSRQQLPKKIIIIIIFSSVRVRADAARSCRQQTASAGEGGGEGRRGREQMRPRGRAVSAWTQGCVRVVASVLPLGNFITDAIVRPSHGRPSGHRPIVRLFVRPLSSA